MPSITRVKTVPRETPPTPRWRASNARPADANDIIAALNPEQSIRQQAAFTTHFMERQHPIDHMLKNIGFYVSEESDVTLTYQKIEIHQKKTAAFYGFHFLMKQSDEVIFMHHVNEAKNDGETVHIIMSGHQASISGLCRPKAFSQAVNRMLASASTPPAENCASCHHYNRWRTEGNQGECALGPPEASSDCPQQGNLHWCPQFEKR